MKGFLKEPGKAVPLCFAAVFLLTLFIYFFPYTGKVIFYPLYREYKKGNMLSDVSGFKLRETDNFLIYYKSMTPYYLDIIEKDAEKSLKNVQNDFKYTSAGKIIIVIYPKYSEMASRIGLGTGSPAMGVYYEGAISILDPAMWMDKSRDAEYLFERQGPVLHELTHYIVDYMSCGNVPVWFTEGVALYEEYRANNVEWANNKKYLSYYTIDELSKNFYGLDETKAYRQSFLILKYIGTNYGMDSIINIIKKLGEGKSIDMSIREVIKLDIDGLFLKSLPQS